MEVNNLDVESSTEHRMESKIIMEEGERRPMEIRLNGKLYVIDPMEADPPDVGSSHLNPPPQADLDVHVNLDVNVDLHSPTPDDTLQKILNASLNTPNDKNITNNSPDESSNPVTSCLPTEFKGDRAFLTWVKSHKRLFKVIREVKGANTATTSTEELIPSIGELVYIYKNSQSAEGVERIDLYRKKLEEYGREGREGFRKRGKKYLTNGMLDSSEMSCSEYANSTTMSSTSEYNSDYRRHPREFKMQLVKEALRCGVATTAKKYKVQPGTLSYWGKQYEMYGMKGVNDNRVGNATCNKYSQDFRQKVLRDVAQLGMDLACDKYKLMRATIHHFRKTTYCNFLNTFW